MTVAAFPPKITPQLTALRKLLAEPDTMTNWLVQDRLPTGGVALLVAKPKVGKSTAARDLALAVAKGQEWLGHQCHQGTVWYLAFEGRREDIKHHFRQMGATGDEPIYVFIDQPPQDMLVRLSKLAIEEHPRLVIVDPLQRLIQAKDTADYAEMTTRLTPLLTMAARSQATLLLVHHAGKGRREDIDAVLGSTAIAGSADNLFLLKRGRHYRTISSIQRIGPDLDETVIELDAESGRVHLGGTRFMAEVAVASTEILRMLQETGSENSLGRAELLEQIEMRRQVKLHALKLLIQQGSIVEIGKGTRSQPLRYRRNSGSDGSYKREPEKLPLSDRDSRAGNEERFVVPGSPNRREPESLSLSSQFEDSEENLADCGSRSRNVRTTSNTGNSGTQEPEYEREPGEDDE
jgi:hypothetical protein